MGCFINVSCTGSKCKVVKVYEVSQQRFQTCRAMVVGFSSASGTRILNLAICRRESKSEILLKWPGMCIMLIENGQSRKKSGKAGLTYEGMWKSLCPKCLQQTDCLSGKEFLTYPILCLKCNK